MRALLIGNGHIGSLLRHDLGIPDELVWTGRIADVTADVLSDLRPDLVINAAGKTDLSFCESHQHECWQSNVVEPLGLYRVIAGTVKCPFIQLSSGCIWDGPYNSDGEPFGPNSQPSPACFYSFSKVVLEGLLRQEASSPVVILRPRQVYSGSQNPRNILVKLCKYESLINTSNSMTSSATISKTIMRLADRGSWERYLAMNVYDSGSTTPYIVGLMLCARGIRRSKPSGMSKVRLDSWHKPRRVDVVMYDRYFENLVDPPLSHFEIRRMIGKLLLSQHASAS